MSPNNDDYLFPGYNGEDVPDPPEPPMEDDFKYLLQGYYDLGDDEPPYDWEEALLVEYYGDYYTSGEYINEGYTREDLLEWADYNNGFYYQSEAEYEAYQAYMEEYNRYGTEPPSHSIKNPVTIKSQNGPKCSAYASSCFLKYFGKEIEPDELYKRFRKLPDGSAIPSSVGKVTGAKFHTNGTPEDLERVIDKGNPVMVLIYYDKEIYWDNLHYVVVTGYDDKNYYIADSLHATGEKFYNRAISKKTFLSMWNTSKSLLVKLLYGKNLYYEFKQE